MSTAPGGLPGLSPSSMVALGWASVAAAHRTGGSLNNSSVGGGELLVGILLAHPGPDGEARVLLEHFGLTARDVLPPDYPTISPEDLRRRAHHAAIESTGMAGEAATILSVASSLSNGGEVHLRHLLGALLETASLEMASRSEEALARIGTDLASVRESYRRWLTSMGNDPGPAGQLLREWLQRENPRHRIDVAGYASDAIDEAHDLIGIRLEADALAYLIASVDVRPPLAIGLFGDWGSGKSFLMRSMKRRVSTLSKMVADSDQQIVPIWRNIKQIEFNAWEYVEGNLWAALLERIFRELGSWRSGSIIKSRREPIISESKKQEKAIEDADASINQLQEEEKGYAEELVSAEKDARNAREEADDQHDDATETARRAALNALKQVWHEQRENLLDKSDAELLDTLAEAKKELVRGRALLGPYWTKTRILLVTLVVLIIPVVAWLLSSFLHASPIVTVLGGLAPIVPLATTALRAGTRWTNKIVVEIEKAEMDVRKAAEKAVTEAEDKVEEIRRNITEVRQKLADKEDDKRRAQDRKTELDRKLKKLTADQIMVDFADERSMDYRSRLGLLSLVRCDLELLQDEVIRNNKAAIAGEVDQSTDVDTSTSGLPNRIVLYIDDLDRCPPAKVIEVLEAVHLLLAFELFVVVVAVDTRWLSSALTDQLVALRPTSPMVESPTSQDYLEKIFQLPFWVQPLSDAARAQLLHGLLAGSIRDTDLAEDKDDQTDLIVGNQEEEIITAMLSQSGSELRLETSPLTLSTRDLTFIESLAPLLGDTPRKIKRFVNVCQLLLAFPPPLLQDPASPNRREIVCFLAAVREGLPTVASQLSASRRSRPECTLSECCDGWKPSPEITRLKDWLNNHTQWKMLSLTHLDVRIDMIDRLGFQPPQPTVSDAGTSC